MNKLYTKILKNPIIIILFIILLILQFISTNIIREAINLESRIIYFSGIVSFYTFGVIFSYFLILKVMIVTIFEKYSILLRYNSLIKWYQCINFNSYKLIVCFTILINISPFLSSIYYKIPSVFDLYYILIFIINQILVLIIINEFFDILYTKYNKTTSIIIIFCISILPNIFLEIFNVNLLTFTEIILINPDSTAINYLIKILINLTIMIIFIVTKSTYIKDIKQKDIILKYEEV